jgi:hypothetical protein
VSSDLHRPFCSFDSIEDKLLGLLGKPIRIYGFYRFSQERARLKHALKFQGAASPTSGMKVQLISPIALFDDRNKINYLDGSSVDFVK